MLPDFLEAKKLVRLEIDKMLEKLIQHHSGRIALDIPHKPIHEGDGFITQYNEEFRHESDLKPIGSSFDINIDEIVNNPGLVFEKFDEVAMDAADQQARLIFDTLSDVTEKAGNVIRKSGKLTPDDFFEMIDKIQIDFNSDGTARMPSFYTNHELFMNMSDIFREIENSEELKKKLDVKMSMKKSEWRDRENNRKLVG